MRLWVGPVAAMALLAGCGGDAGAPPPEPEAAASPAPAASPPAVVQGPERRILAFGDSLFAGYRLGENEGYPEQLEAVLRARGINARVTDAGVSGDTSAAGRQRIAFVLDSLGAPPELALVELGGNDLLRGVEPGETRANLAAILAELQRRDIPVVLMGMRAPPNLGSAYVAQFDRLFADLAAQYGARLVPFFLAPVYDQPSLLQQDHIHPTAAGVKALVAATADDVVAALPVRE